MLKKMINSSVIDLEIIPIDPLLIKSGLASVGGVGMSFVRTHHFGQKEEPFLPGSSLKGMIRSYAEKICRSLRDDPVPVCLPYLKPGNEQSGENRQSSCGLRFEDYKRRYNVPAIPSPDVYSLSCPACRLFGSLGFAGRFASSDAYLTDDFKERGSAVFEIRDGVAIDRITGGTAGGAKYDLEVLTRGEFGTRLEIRNFERWQLGLVGLVLRDMELGLVRIGFGKSRGLGRFKVKIKEFKIVYFGAHPTKLSGISVLCTKKENAVYNFFPETADTAWPLPNPINNGLRKENDITDCWKEALEPAVSDLSDYIKEVAWPKGLENFIERRP